MATATMARTKSKAATGRTTAATRAARDTPAAPAADAMSPGALARGLVEAGGWDWAALEPAARKRLTEYARRNAPRVARPAT